MRLLKEKADNWEKSDMKVFWGEIAPCDHVMQIYENDKSFITILGNFVSDGIQNNEAVILLATEDHIKTIDEWLIAKGVDVSELRRRDQYITLTCEYCLSQFMVDNWPDENLFCGFVTRLLSRAQKNATKVRAFGELVALLWARGHNGATVHLESLWHKLHQQTSFCLYCAYPRSGFTQDAESSISQLCRSHHRLIQSDVTNATEIYHKKPV